MSKKFGRVPFAIYCGDVVFKKNKFLGKVGGMACELRPKYSFEFSLDAHLLSGQMFDFLASSSALLFHFDDFLQQPMLFC